ncbi:MAG: DNA alkylation repair protein [Prevotellaceae bacterium]|jgi:3-methyladenine DNA glycosylase AlkD|nr:DNA alkylation repair protein [Prevotellaceae bacterium]
MTAELILNELLSVADSEKARILQKFFKTGPGQYGEGDVFLGIVVPITRKIVKANLQTPLPEIHKLLLSKYHETRLCALLIITERCKKADAKEREAIYRFYLQHTDYINNWDLVDLSCPEIIGGYLLDKNRAILYQLAENPHLWEQRIAIVSTHAFIRKNEFSDTFALAEKLLNHPHDLIHKATGWMLREIGKRNREALTDFLEDYADRLPRTTLRYAIEHYPEGERQYFLKKKPI